ncbi:hypothetical protein [Chenggangzhangella methanolivorans]|uniref:Antitoxin Xre/MbcA/ParS-like toxin-binding domain-containing protein n=1 Tax=Chenggangzhangella methanolivorans TaxID=1437009 RepID=A0A9E6R6F0_9HYPH|nr:hypothetical protein [Chenggangzhangella methanolivorans]QZN99110.1 hypothetical protein K6K41_20010 [Chenggangzhangella methanolivorans]
MVANRKPTRIRLREDDRVHQYRVPLDRIRSLAADLSDGDELTVLSKNVVSGLQVRSYKRVWLEDRDEASALVPEPAVSGRDESASASPFEPGARARAILRGLDHALNDLAESGGAFSLAEVQKVLGGLSRQSVDKKVKEGGLLAVPGPGNRRRYPTVQFDANGEVVGGLKEVQAALPTRNAWAILNFLINPQDGLGGETPISALQAGKVDSVVAAARRVGQQGA